MTRAQQAENARVFRRIRRSVLRLYADGFMYSEIMRAVFGDSEYSERHFRLVDFMIKDCTHTQGYNRIKKHLKSSRRRSK